LKGDRVFNIVFFILYLLLFAAKIWAITSLGKFWNTKIFRIPEMAPIIAGPYKYLRHPNYLIVISEFAVIPLIFKLYFTAVVFSLLNIIILQVRIRNEEEAWKAKTS
jgi:methyltransferase